jgi:hypothetical protein
MRLVFNLILFLFWGYFCTPVKIRYLLRPDGVSHHLRLRYHTSLQEKKLCKNGFTYTDELRVKELRYVYMLKFFLRWEYCNSSSPKQRSYVVKSA